MIFNERYIGFFDVEVEMDNLFSLLQVISDDYFGHNEEWAIENKTLVALDYEKYGRLMVVSIGLLLEAKETLVIAQKNAERKKANQKNQGIGDVGLDDALLLIWRYIESTVGFMPTPTQAQMITTWLAKDFDKYLQKRTEMAVDGFDEYLDNLGK